MELYFGWSLVGAWLEFGWSWVGVGLELELVILFFSLFILFARFCLAFFAFHTFDAYHINAFINSEFHFGRLTRIQLQIITESNGRLSLHHHSWEQQIGWRRDRKGHHGDTGRVAIRRRQHVRHEVESILVMPHNFDLFI